VKQHKLLSHKTVASLGYSALVHKGVAGGYCKVLELRDRNSAARHGSQTYNLLTTASVNFVSRFALWRGTAYSPWGVNQMLQGTTESINFPDEQPVGFDNAQAYNEDGRIVVKSTCMTCGAFRLVSVRDGSLKKWESRHECPDAPRIPPRSGHTVQ